jgi:hypothetical protein
MALFLSKQNIWLIGRDAEKAGLFCKDDLFESESPFQLPALAKNYYFQASLYESHAAVICEEGLLYTWGSACNGELGEVGLMKSFGRVVDESRYFKARLVLAGRGFTSIVTEGGFLYTYAKPKQCFCLTASCNSYPFQVIGLEEYFITDAVRFGHGIAVLTSLGKVFLTYSCQCVKQLRTNKNVVQIAANDQNVVALASDKSRIYVWSERIGNYRQSYFEGEEWEGLDRIELGENCEGDEIFDENEFHYYNENQPFQCEVLEISKGKICSLFNSTTNYLGICSLNHLTLNDYNEISSPDLSPKYCQQDREKLEELLEKYNFSSTVSHEILNKEEACRTLAHLLSKYLAESFRKVKEAGYLKKLMHRAYAKSCIPTILLKVVNRINFLHKAWSFTCLGRPEHEELKSTKSGKIEVFVECLKKLCRKHNRSFFFKLCKITNFETFLKITASRLSGLSRMVVKVFDYLVKTPRRTLALLSKLVMIKEKLLKLSSFAVWARRKSFELFKSTLVNMLTRRLQSVFAFLLLPSCKKSLKFGLFFLSASISKLLSKQKSFSFNSILRHKPRHDSLEDFFTLLQSIYRPILSLSFHKIRVESITLKHKKIIRLIFAGQSLFEKVKYRKVIKGFNSFKRNLLSKSILSDLSSEQSFKKAYQIFTSSRFETPSNEMTLPNTERSTLETSVLSSARKTIGQVQGKKHSSTDVRSSFMNKSKISEKTKAKKCGLDKRLAYHETLKERQKKKIMQKGQNMHKINKSLSALSFNVEDFDKEAWVRKKYLNGGKVMEGLLRNIVAGKLRLPFNLLKYYLGVRTGKGKDLGKSERKDLHILTKNLLVPESPCKEYYSPIESPIALVNEDTYTLPPTPFVEMLSPKNSQDYQISVWKVKLFALGLNKFSRTVRLLNCRSTWKCLKAKVI